jgi:hypothetical protein
VNEADIVLVEMGLVEQRHKPGLEVINGGASVAVMARRHELGR